MAKNLSNFMLFQKSTFTLYVSKYKMILLTIYLFQKIQFMKQRFVLTLTVFLKYLKLLFQLMFMINIQTNYIFIITFILYYIYIYYYIYYIFFSFQEKDHGTVSLMTSCIMYFSIMGFIQSKLKQQHLLSFLESSLC